MDERIANARPGWALVLLAAPVVGAIVVATLYAGMWWLGTTGRGATGAPVRFAVEGCPEAADTQRGRLADMGLPATVTPTATGWLLDTQLTGRPEVDQRLAEVLAAPGRLEIQGDGQPLAGPDAYTDATHRLDGMMDVWLLLRLTPEAAERVKTHVRAAPRGRLEFVLDGTPVAMQPNSREVSVGEVEGMPLADMDRPTRFLRVAEWSVLADHPLPCPVTLREAPR